ncbi:MAG TPA: Uma2 family endonuclease [Actinocatenispora sp.]
MLIEAVAPPGWRAVPDLNVKIDLADDDYWRPDICVLRPNEKGGLWHTFDQFGLLVEIASPSTTWLDDDEKLHVYARQGVPAYWRVQAAVGGDAPTVYAHLNPSGGAYRDVVTVGPGESARVEVPFPVVIEAERLTP